MALHYYQAGVLFELQELCDFPRPVKLTERVELEYWRLLAAEERVHWVFESSDAIQAGLLVFVGAWPVMFLHLGPEVCWSAEC